MGVNIKTLVVDFINSSISQHTESKLKVKVVKIELHIWLDSLYKYAKISQLGIRQLLI